ncbi:MAG: 16S rRNA (cytidine(1402)-2'-O)-methyltransferase [Candidatus Cloacimonetes bacterium]|nr:16S rRNA (cytidine(1402)-2'-O)-methyltransferase [Candidatus Cloacimonadota bacterium]MBL7148987.1 16S rRNA (cytidine(1402)-2'-O)-methyltransferase [Candidatus Cloacimonadota bacterium]
MKKTGILYIVPTPIGNLADMTFRAVKILKNVALIGAEDTRTSAKLLKHYQIKTPMISYHKFNERSRVEKFLDKLNNGEDVAIISDAGTPGISDPASIIIKDAIENDIKVETLPGATAFIPALVSSCFNTERFYFAGFLPEKKSDKDTLLKELINIEDTIIFYEAPHRLVKFLSRLREVFGNRKIVIARELSKLYETYYRTTIEEVLANPDMITLKGEFVIIVEGAQKKEYSDAEIVEMLQTELDKGESKKDAIKKVQEITGEPRNRIYNLALCLENK